ncbi:MAG: radical SAM/SPASM domain-containing protein [Desulfobacterales bacterium]
MGKSYLGHLQIPVKRVHLELTNICEFNCQFCPKSTMTRAFGSMETGFARQIISELGEKEVCEKITLHVMGEPTLHPDFFQILDHAQEENVKIGLTTNAAGLGRSIGLKLIDYDLHQLDISLQTPDKNSYALRKAGFLDFDQYLKGIFNFFSAYRQKHPNTIIKFRFLVTRFRQKDMENKTGAIKAISSTEELRKIFQNWAGRIYDLLDLPDAQRAYALQRLGRIVSYRWNVVEIAPNLFFETYLLNNWGHAFSDRKVHSAWAGHCFGMRDHFGILYSGDLILCCIDYDGQTVLGNLHHDSLEDILSSDKLGEIIAGFKRFRPVHSYCKQCLGSRSIAAWLFKPIVSVVGLHLLKPFFYHQTRVFK